MKPPPLPPGCKHAARAYVVGIVGLIAHDPVPRASTVASQPTARCGKRAGSGGATPAVDSHRPDRRLNTIGLVGVLLTADDRRLGQHAQLDEVLARGHTVRVGFKESPAPRHVPEFLVHTSRRRSRRARLAGSAPIRGSNTSHGIIAPGYGIVAEDRTTAPMGEVR